MGQPPSKDILGRRDSKSSQENSSVNSEFFLYNALHHYSTEPSPGQEHSQIQSENSISEFLPGLCMPFILYSIETSSDQQYSENLNPNGNSMR